MNTSNPSNPTLEGQGSLFDQEHAKPVEPVEPVIPMISKEEQVKKTSAAFLDMANSIPEQEQPLPHMVPEQPAPVLAQQPAGSLTLGPKFMDALSQLDEITDTKAVQVQLPMSLKTVEMTAITGAEEQSLKTATVAPEAFLKKLNELLYNHTVFEDERPSFSDYLAGVYPPDKSALIWGLLSSSYVVLPEIERECEVCKEKYIIKGTPKDLIHHDTFKLIWDKAVSPAEYTVKQEAFDGFITFEFGIPNERDRIIITGMIHPETMKDNIAKEGNVMSSLDTLVFFTRSITVGEPGSQTVLTNLAQDIYPFLTNLSPKIADGVRSSVDLTIFDDYMPDFYLNAACDHCGAEQKTPMDPEITLFRKSLAL